MKLAVIGEFDADFEPHAQTNAAISHSAAMLGLDVQTYWISTSDDRINNLSEYDALWFAPGSPYKDLAHTLNAIKYARENRVPTIGTCGGFQHMVIEISRNVLGLADAQHAEYDPYASLLIVSRLTCSLVGRELHVALVDGSATSIAYGHNSIMERYYCHFGINQEFVGQLSDAGFRVVGVDADGECRVMELNNHPFFIGTLFVPQSRSREAEPHPLINAFVQAGSRNPSGASKSRSRTF